MQFNKKFVETKRNGKALKGLTPELFNKSPAQEKAVKKLQEKASEVVAPVVAVDPVDTKVMEEPGSKPANQDLEDLTEVMN